MTQSSVLLSSASSLQRCVSPLATFVLYTNEFPCRCEARSIIKFADDSITLSLTVIMSLDEFSDWCKCSVLDINVSKTKDMIMDGRQKSPPTCLFVIYHRAVKVVQLYKYLETVAADTFAFESNIELLLQKLEEVLMLTAPLQTN